MQEAETETVQVTLMGPPGITKRGATDPAFERIKQDADAVGLMALLIVSLLTPKRAGPDPLTPRLELDADRAWLTEAFDPDLFARNPTRARDRFGYVLNILDDKLRFRTRPTGARKKREGKEAKPDAAKPDEKTPDGAKKKRGPSEYAVIGMTLDHIGIDVRAILTAARQLHDEKNQDRVIALGAKRLLEGMAYPWLDRPAFQELRQALDTAYLNALLRKIDSLRVKMESEIARGNLDQANIYRTQALPLIEKGLTRLRALEQAHHCAPRFSELDARFAHLVKGEPSSERDHTPSHNIPQRVTSFVGRDAEMTKLAALLSTDRIVTITGIGGCGKTRLALQAAARHVERVGGEAWLVELAGLTESSAVPQAVAHVLDLPEQKQKTITEALIDKFRTTRGLLVLDNCEHLLEECAPLAETLAQFCPSLTILATSRKKLKIDGERVFPLNTLRVPPTDPAAFDGPDPVSALLEYPAARLFMDRVRLHNDFRITPEHVLPIAAICASLDGIPLALELAAARAAVLSLHKIEELLTDRFQLLTDGRATALPRQKTLRAVVDWSYDLLTEKEQTLLCRCSVFAGGWTLEGALQVGAFGNIAGSDVIDLLTGLIDSSLMTLEMASPAERYRMLETVRQYARDRLRERGEWEATHLRHRAFHVKIADDSQPHLRGPAPELWLDRLDTETDNLRAALAWRADEEAMRLACALSRFWLIRSHFQEGRQWLERTWDDADHLPTGLRAAAAMNAGILACHQNNFSEAKALLEASLAHWEASGDRTGKAEVLCHLGITATFQHRFAEAEELLEASLTLALASGNENGAVDARQALGRLVHAQGNLDRARACYEAILPDRRRQGDLVELADILMYMGIVAAYQDRRAEARDLYIESLALASRLGRVHQVAQVTGGLAELARIRGDYGEAREYCEKSLIMMKKVGAKLGIAAIANLRAAIAYDQGDYSAAEKEFEESRALILALGHEQRAAGMLINIASTAGKQGDYERAGTLFRQCLIDLLKFESWPWIAGCLEDFGHMEAHRRPSPRTVTLLSAADMLREQTRCYRTELEKSSFEQTLAGLRAALGDAAFASAFDAGRAMTKEDAFAFALET